MRKTIREKYNDLRDSLYKDYNKIYVIDNYDFHKSNPYTIFYINKNESFDEFKGLWDDVIYNCKELDDYNYDDVLWAFEERATREFDYVELGTLDIYTDKDYKLEI